MRHMILTGLVVSSAMAYDSYGGGPSTQPFLGVEMSPTSAETQQREGLAPSQGVQVQSVFHGTAAEKAGLGPGDVVVSINGQPISSMSDLRNEVSMNGIGDQMEMVVSRGGQQQVMRTEVQAWPPSVPYEPIDAAAEQRFRNWQERRLAQAKDEAANLQQDVQQARDELAKRTKADTPEQRAIDRAESDEALLKDVPTNDTTDGWQLGFSCTGSTKFGEATVSASAPTATQAVEKSASTTGFHLIISSTTPDADQDIL